MNRREFMDQLRGCLYMLPPDEREAALEYYEEYFDDAGPNNEARVLAELGSPQRVAEQILSGCTERYTPPAYQQRAQGRAHWRASASRFPLWLTVTLAVLGFPLWFPLLITAVVLAFVVLLVLFILALVLVIVTVCLIAAGIGGLVGIPILFSVPIFGVARMGLAIAVLGLGLLLLLPCWWMLRRGVPHFCGWLRGLLRRF